ncbi:glycosyltransferase family 4 protein [Mitsuokella multacida]|uniref:glycosyltransferase family 4 protein n=1 Tax=Mitsuokella multacida TaxID=52226 RepID=UPI002664FB33|nr:glycosyltransferase family 4 protein [Mitsuokella multacida]
MTKEKDVVFLCQFFYPEHNSSATLPFDTAAYLSEQGLKVGALCGYPKEYTSEKNLPLRECVKGVSIHRIRYVEMARRSFWGRIVNYFSFTAGALWHVFELRHCKIILVYSNPPVLPCVALLAHTLFHCKIVYVSYDVYPEVAYASKNLKPGSLIDRAMKMINSQLYRRAAKVVALTDEMKSFQLANRPGLTPERITTIANWAHEKKTDATPATYQRFGYEEGQFIVSYFGNMGICQDMDTLLNAIRLTKDNPKIKYLIIGHGSKKETVKRIMEESPHVQVLDFLVGEAFQQAVAITSVSIVSLEKGLKGMCAPSKYYSYLQGGKAVIAIVEQGSYLAEEVAKEHVGVFVPVGDSAALAERLTSLENNREELREMGQKAARLYDTQYKIEIGLSKYHKMIKELL